MPKSSDATLAMVALSSFLLSTSWVTKDIFFVWASAWMRSASVGLKRLSRTSLSARPLRLVAVLAVAIVVDSGKRHCQGAESFKYS